MCTPSFCVVNLTNFDPLIGCLLYILGFISLWWWWTTFVCWLAIHIAFKKVCLDSYICFVWVFRLVIQNILLYVILMTFIRYTFWKFFLLIYGWPFCLLNNWAKYFHVVIRFSVSFASVSIPFPHPSNKLAKPRSFRFCPVFFFCKCPWFRFYI